jgi:hypothetical protein
MEKLTRKEAFALSVDVYYKKSTKEGYSAEERAEGLRNYLADLNKDYRANKNEIVQIVEDTVDEILPKRVLDTVKNFAEFRQFDNDTTCRFKVKNGKIKTVSVAIGGTVRRVRVDKGWFTMSTEAVMAKVYEEYERVISGQVDWNELINMVSDAINEAILIKVHQALVGIFNSLPAVNKHSSPEVDTAELDKIINVVKAYGQPIIMGTPVALGQLPVNYPANPSEADKADMRSKGYIGMYKGCACVELANSFYDADNAVKMFDDKYLFIIPSGGEKIVKVAMEGGLITREANGQDWTVNFEAYQKVGVGIQAINNIGMYIVETLASADGSTIA